MMEALGRALAQKRVAWAVVALSLLVSGVMGFFALRVGQDDDLLAFLPPENPDIVRFHDIDASFGGTSVAIVGIASDDPFSPVFLDKLRTLTKSLNEEGAIAHALSLSNVEDFRPSSEGGITTNYLVVPLPEDAADQAALRERVMSRDHIVGELIDAEAQAVIIYNFLASGADPRTTAALIQERVQATFPDRALYWGGAPFISTYIYDTTQADMRRLIPWAVLVVIVIIVASFRDVFGALLALLSTAMGIGVSYGLMGLRGIDANIVLSATPVILFAVGSAYAIHVLVRYYALRAQHDCAEAIATTVAQIGPTVAAAGLTTVAGLMSFLAMDIGPMRQFGLYTGAGIFATLVLALTFVPAVVRIAELRSRSLSESIFRRLIVRLLGAAQRSRTAVAGSVLVLAVAGGLLAGRVEARMESAAFFADHSPPAQAERFLGERFGGSSFLQVMVEGDMNDPGVLRELQHLADRIAAEPHVSGVNHIGEVLALVYEAMVGERRLPPSTAQVRVLYRFLAGRPALRQLLTEDRRRALIIVKLDSDAHEVVDPLVQRIEALARDGVLSRYRVLGRLAAKAQGDAAEDIALEVAEGEAAILEARRRELVLARLVAVFREAGIAIGTAERQGLERALAGEGGVADAALVETRVARFLRSDESILEEDQYPLADAIAAAVVRAGAAPGANTLEAAVAEAIAGANAHADEGEGGGAPKAVDEGLAADVAESLSEPLAEAWRAVKSEARAVSVMAAVGAQSEGERAKRLTHRVAHSLLDLGLPSAIVPAGERHDGTIEAVVSGTPVVYRGLSRSVTRNQIQSLALAFGLVLVIMIAVFRSLTAGLLAALPTALTLLVVFGVMGALGVNLDVGTSMLASIIIGAGVDYAVHLLAAWKGASLEEAAEHAGHRAGPAIWTNALMVAAGFFVLTLGEAKPLENVGNLTAAAMLTAAFATFVAVPALARRLTYGR